MEAKQYTKTLQDELDLKLIDQLSGVVSQISSFCFETKKFCVTSLIAILTLMAKFTSDKLDNSIFVAALFIPLSFWLLDSIAFYYQVNIRGTMEQIRQRLASRDSEPLITADGVVIINSARINIPVYHKVLRAAFNNSMWLYAVLIVADFVIWWLFITGKIN